MTLIINKMTVQLLLVGGMTLIIYCYHQVGADVNVDDDMWVLKNMMRSVTVSDQTTTELGWFNYSDTGPCDWNWTTCNNNSRIIDLDFDDFWEYDGYINTTYWPTKIKSVNLDNPGFHGALILDNLPNTIQWFNAHGCCIHINLNKFPNISHLSNLDVIGIDLNYSYTNGVAEDLGLKLPNNLRVLEIYDFVMDKFPHFSNFSQLQELRMKGGSIENGDSFVSSILPPKLEDICLEHVGGLTGDLDFRSLMPHSPNLTYIYLDTTTTFSSVDFRGINDNTHVYLSSFISCTVNSIYGDNNNAISSNVNYGCLGERTSDSCTGEKDCLSTCQCFEIPQDWQPALNDFYTYVNFCAKFLYTTQNECLLK